MLNIKRVYNVLTIMLLFILGIAIVIPLSSIKVAKKIDAYLLEHLQEHGISVKDSTNLQYDKDGFKYSIRFDDAGTMYIGYHDKNSGVMGVNTVESDNSEAYTMLDLLDMTEKVKGIKWYSIHKDSLDESLWVVNGKGSTTYTINPYTSEVIKN